MKSFNEYAEKAINRYNLNGYNNLAKELNVDKSAVSFFRSGKSLPSESTMIKLAELAGLPKEEALIDLNLWRAKKNPELSKVWSRIAKMIKSTAPLILLYAVFTSTNCFASENTPILSQEFDSKSIYYATKYRFKNISSSLFYVYNQCDAPFVNG